MKKIRPGYPIGRDVPIERKVIFWFLLAVGTLLFFLAPLALHAQERSNTYYAAQFPGPDVGTKISNVQTQCGNNALPCIVVIDAILSKWPVGTLPARCATCLWMDYRVNGALTITSLQSGMGSGSCLVDGVAHLTIQSAISDLACAAAYVPGISQACYLETLTANLTLRNNFPIYFLGCAVITQGAFQVTATSGQHDITIYSPFVHSQTPSSSTGVTFSGYTGSGAAWSIGDSSGTVLNYYEHGIGRNLDTGAQANAQGLLLTNVQNSSIESPWFTIGAVSGQKAISTNGTGAFFTGLINISGLECGASSSATNDTCLFVGAITNSINLYGGHANMGGSLNGSTCIDVNGAASSGVTSFGFDCDVAQTGVKVESASDVGFWGFIRADSGLTNIANFGAGSQGNVIYTNGNLPFTDSGVGGTNSVINPARFNWRTDKMQVNMGSTFAQWIDVTDSSARLIEIYGAGGNKRLNSGTGASQILFNFDNGTGGFNFCHGTGATTSCTLWNPSTTAQRTLTSPDGNSATVVPFSFTTTAAATDNVAVTGMTSSGHCDLQPTNSAAAAGIASVFVSAKAANQITVTHTATAGWTFDGMCTGN